MKISLLLICLLATSCKPFKRDLSLEKEFTLNGKTPVATYSQRRHSDDWCHILLKYEISQDDYMNLIQQLGLKRGLLYSTMELPKEADPKTIENWNPGPGEKSDQKSSELSYSKLIEQPKGYPDSYIESIYRDGYAYLKITGFKSRLIHVF